MGAGLEGLAQLLIQGLLSRQPDPVIFLEGDLLPFHVFGALQPHIDAGQRLVAEIDRLVGAELLAGKSLHPFVTEGGIADQISLAVFALELDRQVLQGFGAHIFKAEADRHIAAGSLLKQVDADKLHRAALGVIVGFAAGHQLKLLFQCNATSFWVLARPLPGRPSPCTLSRMDGRFYWSSAGACWVSPASAGWADSAFSACSAISADSAVPTD